MGSVIRSRVVNIFEIPKDVLLQLIGAGFELNEEGKLTVDQTVDESHCFEFVSQTDSCLWLEGRKLMLTKHFQKYKVLKNRHGHVINIVEVGTWESTDEVLLTDYGAVSYMAHSGKFYKN